MTTVTLQNPWTGVFVEKGVQEIVDNIFSYPWPDDLVSKVNDQLHDTDTEWVVSIVELMGPELAGKIILGS